MAKKPRKPKAKAEEAGLSGLSEASSAYEAEAMIEWTKIGPGGRVVIPAAMRRALGLNVDDPVQLHLEGEELRLIPAPVVYRRFREFVQSHVPPGVNLVDELIEDRKREAEMEERGE